MATLKAVMVAGGHLCGFCVTGDHVLCPETVQNGSAAAVKVWVCPCHESGHVLGKQPPLNRTVARLAVRPLPRPVAGLAGPAVTGPGPVAVRRKAAGSPFPAGVCSPYQFRAVLAERGLVPGSFRPQTVYTWVTQAGRGGSFPVRFYAAGEVVPAGSEGARPGVPVDEAVAWVTSGNAGL
jgi:hypothetical protein